ncbi:disease resistance protein RPV1-like [Argentina anserina]|uniref:disease resistance protein RPV1-like n=1 Tax=Argentina anserina TaxID=57926 RepID=UPI002176422A|nr:disease resistance protein RPV1-like [Potentilla anserina]
MASPAAQAAASSSSTSLPPLSTDQPNHYTYEVFLSFRGEDTRYGFTDHLHSALYEKGIKTFIDDELRRGEEISSALVKAIEESRVSVVVFSQNYASSRWCLDELVKILECRKSKGQEVRSVFYKVDPSDVRYQRGAFGKAFAKLDQHKHKDSMEKWKAALTEAADLSGWPYKDGEYEAKFIKKIVGELSARVVNPSCELHVATHPVGLGSCTKYVIQLLQLTKENVNVRMVGIWGPGGIGKTTIAKNVFNSIRHEFEGSCFLEDVRSNSNGLEQLQDRLLFDISKDSTLKVTSVNQGVGFIKARMRHKKVLLVLDDVSHSSQLQRLAPSPECFGPGSRVLITTRDTRLLKAHDVDEVYEVKMLNYYRALELFSLNAFKRIRPPDDYLELARRAVSYAQGLPLALVVLGSHLYRRSREEWKATLDRCRGEDPHREISVVLKISYDALGVELKRHFLDIACFFKGKLVDDVKPILDACYDLKSVKGIAQLQEKALIRIDGKGSEERIWMHDLIEEIGKDIVYQESPDEPGERSRVWSAKDADHVLTNNTGTNKIIAIHGQFLWLSSTISLNAKSFSEMKSLKYISMGKDLKYEHFSGCIDYMSNQLRWLDWPQCPLQSFPSEFCANKLVKLNIPDSWGLTRLWEGRKNLSGLTCINLRGCKSLTQLPDFSRIPSLKELDLSECISLVEVPDSVGFLGNLVSLNVNRCSNLIMFPRKIHWKSMKTISINHCKLQEFSEVGEELDSLTNLDLSGTWIKELPASITNLIGLEELKLVNCHDLTTLPSDIYELHNLKVLDVSGCSKLATFPAIPMQMDSLRQLFLERTDIRELDQSIGNLIGLEWLFLNGCKNLTTLPSSIYDLQNLEKLHLSNCSKLVRFPTNTYTDDCSLSLPSLRWFALRGCNLSDCDFLITLNCWETIEQLDLSRNNIVSLPDCIRKSGNLRWLSLEGCKRLRDIPELPPNLIYYTGASFNLIKSIPTSWLSFSSEPVSIRPAREMPRLNFF